jgi:hypothetical protein
MDPVVIGARRRHWAVVAAVGTSLAVVGGALIGLQFRAAVGWVTLVVAGAAALFGAWQFYDGRPRVVIDDRGVLDRRFAIGLIPWTDIEGVRLKRMHGRAQLCLDLRDAAKYTSRLPSSLQRMVHLNRELGLTDLSVDLTGLTSDPVDLEARLRNELDARRV